MIHEYLVFISFLSLSLIFLSVALSLKHFFRLVKSEKPRSEQRKISFWRRTISFFVLILLISRIILLFIGPSELLNMTFISPRYIDFFLSTVIFCILWFMIIYFVRIEKYFKPEMIVHFEKRMVWVLILLVLIDLIVSGYLFLTGYAQLFWPVSDLINPFRFKNFDTFIPLLVFVAATFILTIIFYLLFSVKRTMSYLNQFLLSFLVLMGLSSIFLFTATAYVLGWNESLHLKVLILSWHYGFAGQLLAFFFSVSMFTCVVTLFILFFRRYFFDPARIRMIVLPLMRFGIISLTGYTLMVVLPFLYNYWNF